MKKLKIDMHDVMIVLIALAFIFVISVLNEKGICVRGAIAKRNVYKMGGCLRSYYVHHNLRCLRQGLCSR